MTSISCRGAVVRRDEISCRPASEPSTAAAGQGKITIAWDLNEADKPAGFRVFYGLGPRKYKECVDIRMPSESSPGVMKYTLTNLYRGKRYYIAVIAYDKNNSESGFSGEVNAVAE